MSQRTGARTPSRSDLSAKRDNSRPNRTTPRSPPRVTVGMRGITIALLGALAVVSCSKKDRAAPDTVISRPPAAAPAAPAAGSAAGSASTGTEAAQSLSPAPLADHRKVIRTGRVELVVASYDEARGKLDALLTDAGGYVDSTRVARHRGAVSAATLIVRIPSRAFPGLLPRLAQLGEVTSETTDAADITDQYVDTEARLASAQQLEKRLLELATARNGTIDQVLAVERELARVRGEIEGYQGHLRQWSDQVALSTLTIELLTRGAELPDQAPPSFGSQSSSTLRASLTALRDFASWAAIMLIALLPWLIVAVPVYLVLRRIVIIRRRRRPLPPAIARPPVAGPPAAGP
jgi:hypothetical protein